MKLNKQYEKKHNELITQLNKKVEILKELLNTNNIMYVDINPVVDEINMLKHLITQNQLYNDIEYTSKTMHEENTEEE